MIQSVLDQTELQDLAKRVDTAVQAVRDLKGDAREKALAMKTAIEEFHKSALTRMIQ